VRETTDDIDGSIPEVGAKIGRGGAKGDSDHVAELLPFPRALNAAARASRSRLDRILDAEDVSFREYVAMNLLASSVFTPDTLHSTVRRSFEDDLQVHLTDAQVDEALRRMTTKGLLTERDRESTNEPSAIELTSAGADLHAKIQRAVAATSAKFVSGIDADELAVTHRVLHELGLRGED
jgi:hypothetical protein